VRSGVDPPPGRYASLPFRLPVVHTAPASRLEGGLSMARPTPGTTHAPTRSRRIFVLVAGVVAVAAVAAAAAVIWWSGRSGEPPAEGAPAPTPSVTLGPARATEIAQQMTSGDEAQVRQALVLPTASQLDPQLIPGLAGMRLEMDTDSYTPTGANTATVEARVIDAAGATSTWSIDLLLTEDAAWQVLATVPQGDS
jgi:hypothetical protein